MSVSIVECFAGKKMLQNEVLHLQIYFQLFVYRGI